jgi:hypothetical protein
MRLLDQLWPNEVYWRAVLRYCAAGGLQAVLDEYVHVLRSATSDLPLTCDAARAGHSGPRCHVPAAVDVRAL